MSFEIFLKCCGETERLGLPRSALRSLFPVIEDESEADFWRVRYDSENQCAIGVSGVPSNGKMLNSLYVDRPCGDLRLWEGLLSILRMGSVVIFWPGGPLVVADGAVVADLPRDIIESLGEPKVVNSAEALLRFVQES